MNRSVIDGLRNARARGEKLTALGEKLLAEAEREEGRNGKPRGRGTVKLAGALYLLGASQNAIALALGISRATVASHVRASLPREIRDRATKERDFGRAGVLMETIDIVACLVEHEKRREEFERLDAVRIAAALKKTIEQPAVGPDVMDGPSEEPY